MQQAKLITELKRIAEDCTTQEEGKPCQTHDGSIIELAIIEIESLTRNAEVCVYREIAPLLGIPQKVGFIEQTKERISELSTTRLVAEKVIVSQALAFEKALEGFEERIDRLESMIENTVPLHSSIMPKSSPPTADCSQDRG